MSVVWFNLGLLAIVTTGLVALVIGLVNRIHAYPLSHGWLHRIRQGHDLVIPGIPIVLLWFTGIRGAGLLHSGTWWNLSLEWKLVFATGCFGTMLLLVRSVRRALRRKPEELISCDSRVIDVSQELGFRPVGHGPYELMTRIPQNEVFHLEISEKRFRLPRLPAEWDGLMLLHLSDFHFIGTVDRPYFEYVVRVCQELNPDLIVFTGDLLDNADLAAWIPDTLGRLTAKLGCYFILGNHDWYLGPHIGRQAMAQSGWIDVADRYLLRDYRGRSLLIAGTEYPWMGANPDLSAAPETDFRLLLSHTPDNLGWARRNRFDLMLSGHNHGGQIRLPLIGPVYAPSKFGCYYADGVFREVPTLLHVSRGLAGRHPWRWHCPPEITKVILQRSM